MRKEQRGPDHGERRAARRSAESVSPRSNSDDDRIRILSVLSLVLPSSQPASRLLSSHRLRISFIAF